MTTHEDSPQRTLSTPSQSFSASSAHSALEIIEPDTAEALAGALRRASEARQSIVISGAGTKMDWGRRPGRIDAILSTRRLNRVLAHQHGDLTATVEAGATLRDVNETLARHGQCLPLDPPFAERATIGGILATNDSGPLRHRFGTPRDLVIGVQLATVDGALAKAGGQVVKNVAGYDLSKLVCGSFGSLVAIVGATFKLSPLPSASKTIMIGAPDIETLGQIVRDMMSSQLEPIAFEIDVSAAPTPADGSPASTSVAQPFRAAVILRFASLPRVVDAQVAQTLALPVMKGCATTSVDGDAERAVWDRHARQLWDSPGAIVRASWLPADLQAALKGCVTAVTPTGVTPTGTTTGATPTAGGTTAAEVVGRAAVGAGLIRIAGDARSQAAAIEQLRRSTALRHVVVVRGSDELKSLVDVWGPMGDREKLFASLKRTLDPHGVLNAGRGPL